MQITPIQILDPARAAAIDAAARYVTARDGWSRPAPRVIGQDPEIDIPLLRRICTASHNGKQTRGNFKSEAEYLQGKKDGAEAEMIFRDVFPESFQKEDVNNPVLEDGDSLATCR